jgi:hypothetical protein
MNLNFNFLNNLPVCFALCPTLFIPNTNNAVIPAQAPSWQSQAPYWIQGSQADIA